MNFSRAIATAKTGLKVRRESWDEDMAMWWTGQFLAHSHPYSSSQDRDAVIGVYTYVVEFDDVEADDWQQAV